MELKGLVSIFGLKGNLIFLIWNYISVFGHTLFSGSAVLTTGPPGKPPNFNFFLKVLELQIQSDFSIMHTFIFLSQMRPASCISPFTGSFEGDKKKDLFISISFNDKQDIV